MVEEITQEEVKEDIKELSPIEEARKVLEEMKEVSLQLQEANKQAANNLLAGTTGGNVKPKVVEVTPEEYAEKALNGEISNEKE